MGIAFGIESYSSVDLQTWKYEGYLFDPNSSNAAVCLQSGGCGRPHMIYNPTSKQYILWTNADRSRSESSDIFKQGGYYYVAASNTCGYRNGSIGLLYRAKSIQGPWTRQILSGYSCEGQVEGVLPLVNSQNGQATIVWHSTSVPGGPRTGSGGHIFQPLVFINDGSAQPLNCDANAKFTVPFTKGTASIAICDATEAVDATPTLAVYSPVCDSDSFMLHQTWAASKSGTLKGISVNIVRGNQLAPLAITVYKFSSYANLLSPTYKYTTLGTASINASQISHILYLVTVPVIVPVTNGTVSKGDLLDYTLSGPDYSPQCHLEYANGASSSNRLFQQGQGQYSCRNLQAKNPPIYQRVGQGIKFTSVKLDRTWSLKRSDARDWYDGVVWSLDGGSGNSRKQQKLLFISLPPEIRLQIHRYLISQ
ncbi:hypothetical protein H2203_002204 [Taxawa tesnikishii (nom. ined.)]|nr:hypothetical protein H2203_002204 [Dothideales sp. JES 119]